jgi:hypothetical protein
MKPDCILQPKSHIKLSPLASTPNSDELKQLHLEVQKHRNCSIELPWVVEMIRFALEVCLNLEAQEPIWTLYQGDGVRSHKVWSSPFVDTYLLREVVALSIAEIVLEHKQEKLTANAQGTSLVTEQYSNSNMSNASPINSNIIENAPEDDSSAHSYRNLENSLASFSDIVTQRVSKNKQPAKTEQTSAKPEQLLHIAEESINKAGESINKAEQSINKAEKSINKAEQSINKAEQSINKVEQIIDGINNIPTPPPAYAYVYPGNSPIAVAHSIPIAPSAGFAAPNLSEAITLSPITAPPFISQPATAAQPLRPETNVRASSIRVEALDLNLLHKQTKFLLGQFLVDSNIVPQKTLDVALKVQKMIAGNIINTEQAISTISRIHFRNGNFEMIQLMQKSAANDNKIVNTDFPLLGELLIKAGILDDPTLEAALKMQELVRAGAMNKEKACEFLNKEFVLSGRTKSNIDKIEQAQQQKIVNLLLEVGLINKEDKKIAQDVQQKFGGEIGDILVSAHKLSKIAYEAACECDRLIGENKIKPEEYMIALNYCERSRVSLTDALNELGFQLNSMN